MKKVVKMFMMCMALTMLITFVTVSETQAAPKKASKKVTYSLKKGILTVSGKGDMPKSMSFEGNGKIKKVVIKKGITSIPNSAFKECWNLKRVSIAKTVKKIGRDCFSKTAIEKITIPKNVKVIGQCALEDCENLEYVTMPGGMEIDVDKEDIGIGAINCSTVVKSVTFNTNFKIKSAAYFRTQNLYVMENDLKYKSIDGVVYTKDGKSIVRVPNGREEITIVDGCTEFCLQSVLYCGYYWEGDGVNPCWNLKSIVIPKSVEKISENKYYTYSNGMDSEERFGGYPYIFTDKLKGNDFVILINNFPELTTEKLAEQLPNQVKIIDDMVISSDGVFIKYEGKKVTVNIPDDVKRIGAYAFYNTKYSYSFLKEYIIKKVNMPDTVTHIDKYAFAQTDIVFEKLPSQLKYIGEAAFLDCGGFKNNNIVIPNTVRRIGNRAFRFVQWKKLVIPKNVIEIGDYAFDSDSHMKRKVIVKNQGKKISSFAFSGEAGYEFENLEIEFAKGIRFSKTCIYTNSYKELKNNKVKIGLVWAKITNADGYKIKVSTDKKFKKDTQIIWADKKDTSKKVIIKNNKDYAEIYVCICPYKVVRGKKVYGKWTSVESV